MADILIVEDSRSTATAMAFQLWNAGHTVRIVSTGEEAIREITQTAPDLTMLDYELPDINGLDLFRNIRQIDPQTPVVMVTGKGSEMLAAQVLKEGARDYLIKSNTFLKQLAHTVEQVLREENIKRELEEKEEALRQAYNLLEKRVEERTAELARASRQLQREIIERSKAQEALKESEATHRALVENNQDVIIRFDRSFRHLYVNPAVRLVVDLAPEDCLGRTHRELGFPPHLCDFWEDCLRTVFRTGKPFETEFQFKGRKDRMIFDWRLTPEFDGAGQVKTVLSVSRDVTAARIIEENYRMLFNEMLDGFALHEIILSDDGQPVDYRFLDVNPAFEKMTGLKAQEVVGRTVLEVMPELESDWLETYGRVARTGRPLRFQNYAQELGKHFEVVAFSPQKDRFACIFQDITERLKSEADKTNLETRLRQAQKMEAIGTLAGGIAHDFNNILSAITGYTELALLDLPADHPAFKRSKQVLKAGRRAKDLVKHILTFSRQGEQVRQPVELGPIVKEAIKFLRASLPTTIEIKQDVAPDTGLVMADSTQIHQVLMNLCTNAAHAMRETGGLLGVSLKRETLDKATTVPGLKPGGYIKLTVSDTGHGMERAVMDRIFEPFFTTKEKGEGTGMGLSVVHGIISSHGGTINLHSVPDQGSEFNLYLPIIRSTAREQNQDPTAAAIPRGTERILFVDDEKPLADLGQLILTRLGYQVTTESSSLRALELFHSRSEEFDLVITDLTMPQMTGVEMTRKMLAIRPDLPIILCTGFSEKLSEEQAAAIGIRKFIKKPLLIRDLAEVIREVLARPSSLTS